MSNRVRVVFMALLVALIVPVAGAGLQQAAQPAPPQQVSAAATLSGVVVDKDGGNVPGATVVLTRTDTGEKLPKQTTNGAGQYSFTGLAAGKYKLTISLQGFK